MRKAVIAVIFIAMVTASFVAGNWYQKKQSGSINTAAGRKILYYADPMNPAIKSDKPGVAPCGMALEPVYADDKGSTTGAGLKETMPPGAVQVSPERQQLIGIKVAGVEKKAWTHTLRVTGRVAADELLTYRINAAVVGWIKKIFPVTTDSFVKKDDLLAIIYSPEFLSPGQTYLFAIRGVDPTKFDQAKAGLEVYRDALRNLGMTDHQLDEMLRTRPQAVTNVEIRSPEAGFVLARNVSLGQRFERGVELYRIADLSHVWILADVFENEAQYFRPGDHARVTMPYQGKTFTARVSNIVPQFDATSRTLRVRLEMDNPGFVLKPGMFVDIELPVVSPPSIAVPVDAVIFSGTKKTVYIDDGNGFFEPRNVETGWSFGSRIAITKGLSPGETIVVSGNFLIDSESRMKTAGERKHDEHKDIACNADDHDCKAGARSGMKMAAAKPSESAAKQKDLVCGMEIDPAQAKAHGRMSEYKGKKYYFCSDSCKKNFDKDPEHYMMKHDESHEMNNSGQPNVKHD